MRIVLASCLQETHEEGEAVTDDDDDHGSHSERPHGILDDSRKHHIDNVGVAGKQVQNAVVTSDFALQVPDAAQRTVRKE